VVAQNARPVNDLLVSILNLIGGGVVGYIVGVRQGRKQTQYEQRVRVVTEVRKRLREARRAFANMATPPEYRIPAEPFGAEEVEEAGKRLDALADYVEDNADWLDVVSYQLLDELTDHMAFLWADVRGRLDANEDPSGALRAAWEWLVEADEEIHTELGTSIGTRAPWWRRIFGG
jgi:hypothetical protein